MRPGWDALQDLRSKIAGKPVDQPKRDIASQLTDPEALQNGIERIVTARVLTHIATEGKRLSKLAEAAERIAKKKAVHDAKGDEWAARLDALDQREPGAFAIGDSVIDERETDLGDMERTMRTLSNLPNVVSGKS